MPGFFNMPYGELRRREFTVRFGRITSINDNDKRMQVEMCDTPGVYVEIFYQNMVQPMIASGTSSVNGWGIYSIPVANIGTIAVIIFHKNEFPLVVGYMASDYKKAITKDKMTPRALDDIKSGEIKIKCFKQSEIYFDENGDITLTSFRDINTTSGRNINMVVHGNLAITTDGDVLLNGSDGVVLAPNLPPGSPITNINQLFVATKTKGE